MSGVLTLSSQISTTVSSIATPSHSPHEYRVAKQPRAHSSHPRVASDTSFYCRYRECKRRPGGGGKAFLRKDNRNTHEKIHERTLAHGSQEHQPASALPQLDITNDIVVRPAGQVYSRMNGDSYHAMPGDQQFVERFEMSDALN